MKRRQFNKTMLSVASASLVYSSKLFAAADESWAVRADVAESCSCGIPCPCNFGHPTDRMCNGSRLVQIKEGRFGGEDLAGVSFIVTFQMNSWTKIYVDDKATARQMNAFEGLLPVAFKGFHKLMRSLDRVPMEIVRTPETLRYSVPESTVEIELVKGLDGQAITVDGLPSPMFVGYTQYQSKVHRHKSSDFEFDYAGTNGFTSRLEIGSGR